MRSIVVLAGKFRYNMIGILQGISGNRKFLSQQTPLLYLQDSSINTTRCFGALDGMLP